MNKSVTLKSYLSKFNTSYHQFRYLATTQCAASKNAIFNKGEIDKAETLMRKAPKWNESNATESEADVKADQEPTISPEILCEETAEWVRSHKDKDGNIPPQ